MKSVWVRTSSSAMLVEFPCGCDNLLQYSQQKTTFLVSLGAGWDDKWNTAHGLMEIKPKTRAFFNAMAWKHNCPHLRG